MKIALKEEFSIKIDSHSVHLKIRQRKKGNNVTYHEYCYKIIEIGAHNYMEHSAVIEYIM